MSKAPGGLRDPVRRSTQHGGHTESKKLDLAYAPRHTAAYRTPRPDRQFGRSVARWATSRHACGRVGDLTSGCAPGAHPRFGASPVAPFRCLGQATAARSRGGPLWASRSCGEATVPTDAMGPERVFRGGVPMTLME